MKTERQSLGKHDPDPNGAQLHAVGGCHQSRAEKASVSEEPCVVQVGGDTVWSLKKTMMQQSISGT